MEETKTEALPEAQSSDSCPAENHIDEEKQTTIPVKFNKETKNLTAEEAATLAQKGLKFQMIEDDFLRLKTLAASKKMSVPEYISDLEKIGAEQRKEQILSEYKESDALATRIVELENREKEDEGLEELRKYFPTVKNLSDLPRAVVESARLRGENLLNSYLKYRLISKRKADDERLFEHDAKKASVGSLKGGTDTADDDFIKALWGK